VGRIAALVPNEPDWTVVNWHNLPKLQGSKVNHNQLVKALRPGDRIAAIAEVIAATSLPPPSGQLAVDDLIFAVRDLPNGVPEGTAGYITDVLPGDGAPNFRTDFPQFPQFGQSTATVSQVMKAPRVADRVVAVRDIKIPSGVVVRKGSAGVVSRMTPERGTYTYTVTWEDVPQASSTPMRGLDLAVKEESYTPAPLKIPTGATGTVLSIVHGKGLWNEQLAVAWDATDRPAANANVSRGQVDKVPDWSAAHRSYCCKEKKVGCLGASASSVLEPFACDTNAQVWVREEADWCCQNRGLRCDLASKDVAPQKPLFNCRTREVWPDAKSQWCCLHERLGCQSTTPATA